jgi:hypothetical protein
MTRTPARRPRPIMYGGLHLEEIAVRIVRYLEPADDADDEVLAHLATLARTCRVFTEPTLDILWRASPMLHLA